jgi:hypothetical protein
VPTTDIRLEAVSLPADAHTGAAADAGDVVAKGDIRHCQTNLTEPA